MTYVFDTSNDIFQAYLFFRDQSWFFGVATLLPIVLLSCLRFSRFSGLRTQKFHACFFEVSMRDLKATCLKSKGNMSELKLGRMLFLQGDPLDALSDAVREIRPLGSLSGY